MTNQSAQVKVMPALRAPFALTVGLLAFATFVIVTAEFVVVGLLPVMANDLDVSLAEAGWFVTWFALAAGLLGPPVTMMAGQREPRQILLVTALIFAVGNLIIALAPHHAVVVMVRIAQGCALPAFLSVATVAAARMAGTGREGWAISLVNFGVVAVTVLGVPAGVLIADRAGWPATFAALALLGFISAGLIAAWFPRMAVPNRSSMRSEVSLLRRPHFLAHLLLSGLMLTAMFAGYTYIAAILATVAGLDGAMIGWMLLGFGIAGAFGNWIAGRVVDRDPLAATAWVAVALALAMAVIAPAGGMPLTLAFVVGLWGAAHTAAFVFNQVRVMAAGHEAPTFAMSLYISIANLGIALGAVIGGGIVARYGIEAVGYGGAVVAAAALLLTIGMIAARHRFAGEHPWLG